VYGDRGGDWVDEESEPSPCSARGVVRLEHERAWERALAAAAAGVNAAGGGGGNGHGDGGGGGGGDGGAAPAPPALRVFRLGGIYGPGRSVLEPLLAAGGPRDKDDAAAPAPSPQRARRRRQRFTSRVHVADAARAALASAEQWRRRRGGAAGGGEGGGVGGSVGDGFPPLPARVYNVVDDLPAPRSEVEAYARERLRAAGEGGRLAEEQDDGENQDGGKEEGARTRAAGISGDGDGDGAAAAAAAPPPPSLLPPLEEKRVRNARLKRELLGQARPLLYPDYRPAIDELVARL